MSMMPRLISFARPAFAAWLVAVLAAPVAADWRLDAATWARPRHGDWLVREAALSQAVQALLASPDGRLLLRYPGGDAGSLWVSEMKAWLVALGIASDRIELVPGNAREDEIRLELLAGGRLLTGQPSPTEE